ncbi:MAG: glycosyltransferase family 9 protein [Deltaproteobacteria bacterium]|nr:glycosyltransferase family 9 protein [Deltaproteobacteria bacterium]
MNMLIIRPAALGDTLMLAPALIQLRHTASVTLVGGVPGIDHVRGLVDVCLDFEAPGWHSLFTDAPDLPGLPPAALLVAFLRDPDRRVKRSLKAVFPEAQVHVFPGLPPDEEDGHVALYLARCLEAAGAKVDAQRCFEEACWRALLRGEWSPPGAGRIILHPGSGGCEKNHPPEFWFDLVCALNDSPLSGGRGVLLLLGPAEESVRPFFETRLKHPGMEILVTPGKEELVSVLGSARLYLGHDSGITHLAAMMGAPTLALFRDSSIRRWRPLGPRVKVIQNRKHCAGLVFDVMEEAKSLIGEDVGIGWGDH